MGVGLLFIFKGKFCTKTIKFVEHYLTNFGAENHGACQLPHFEHSRLVDAVSCTQAT